ncbi:MAG: LPS assembly lipoprotein LptE [Bacteroidota bacterium]|nr:LPS assembly lipoprotein LptE [Bacteroidota bacterium]
MKPIINILASILITSCGIYSFTGASIPHEAKTVSVAYFTTTATNAPSSLNQIISEGLKDLFLSQTSLNLTEVKGDLSFSGEITKYQISPMAIQANETAGQNRLIIAIKVKYNNSFDNQQNFESTFSRYRDFNSSENLADVETVLIEEITKELLEDVFNKAFVNW